MIDVPSLEMIGRKELQALAKEHGIKANQKSAVLLNELRAVLLQNNNIADDDDHDDDAQEGNDDAASVSAEEKSNGEQVNGDPDGSMSAMRIVMQVEDTTPAEESPTGSEITTADDRIELCLVLPNNNNKASEEDVPYKHIIHPNEENVADATAKDVLAGSNNCEEVNADDRKDSSSPFQVREEPATSSIVKVEDAPIDKWSPTGSEMANVAAHNKIELFWPSDASKENVHNDTIINANEESAADATAEDILAGSQTEEVNVDERKDSSPFKVREEPGTSSIVQVEDAPIDKWSPTSSKMANVATHNKIELPWPSDASKENVHNDTIINANEENAANATADSMLANSEEVHVDKHEIKDRSPIKPSEKHVHDDIIINENEEHSVNVTAESMCMAADIPASDDGNEVNVDEGEISDRLPIEPREEQASEEGVHNGISISAIEEHFADATAERTVADNPGSDDTEIANVPEREIPDRSTSTMRLEDTPAEEEPPSGSEVTNIAADDMIELSSPYHTTEENVHNDTFINANEENVPDATTEDMLPSSDSEEVNVDQDCSPTEQTGKHPTFIILDTPADEPPTRTDDVSDNDMIEFSLPGKTSKENTHNDIVINENEENVPDATAEDMLAEKLHFAYAFSQSAVAYKSDSEKVTFDKQETADRSPTNPTKEYATSVMQLVDKSAELSPTTSSSEMVNVFDKNKIDVSSPGKASEENAHIVILKYNNEEKVPHVTTEDTLAEKRGSESGEVNVDEREIEDGSPTEPRDEPATGALQVEEDTSAEETRTSSEKAHLSDDRIEVSLPSEASTENVHIDSVQSEDNTSAAEPAVSSIEGAIIDDQETGNPVTEEEGDGYSEIFQSEHHLDEKLSDDAVRSPSVEEEVSHDESICTLTIDSFTRLGKTEHAFVDKAGMDNEKEVAHDESSEKTSEALVEKCVNADEESEEGHSADGGSANDTKCSRTATTRQHEHRPVEKKVNLSAPACKMAQKERQRRPLSKGEQMSFGYIRKPLPSISTIPLFPASTHKCDARKAKSLPSACKVSVKKLSTGKRPTSSGNKKVLAVKESKPRVPLQTLSSQKDKPNPFPANTHRPVYGGMSERNEKQFRKFLDRQAAAREKRAKGAVPAEFHRN